MNNFFFSLLAVFFSFSKLGDMSAWAKPVQPFVNSLPQVSAKPTPQGPVRKINQSRGVQTTAQSALVLDATSDKVLFAKNPEQILAIASLTKLMSATVLQDLIQDWEKPFVIAKEDRQNGNKQNFFEGDTLTLNQLWHVALVGSDNDAIAALVRATSLTPEEFVGRMNEKAKALGMTNTAFSDATGLTPANKSSAQDILILLKHSLSNEKIREALGYPKYYVQTRRGLHYVYNTNQLISSFLNRPPYQIVGGKTGFIDESGYNLAVEVKNEDKQVMAVVLGSKTSDDRFREVKNLVHWAFENYDWSTVKLSGL